MTAEEKAHIKDAAEASTKRIGFKHQSIKV